METLGRARDGWTKRKAKAELHHRLADVDREGLRRVSPTTFETFAREWLGSYPNAKNLKHSTRGSYETIVDKHLVPEFGSRKLEAISVGHLEDYVARKRRNGLAPRSISRHLNLLHLILDAARKRGLVRTNPVADVDRPREPRRRWRILSPVEVARVERAFRKLAETADAAERRRIEQARVVFLVVLGTGLRRGEILGLRWRAVDLADSGGALRRVVETWVRDGVDTPKSEAGKRTIALGPALAEELWQHRRASGFSGEDERVFCHPETGGPLPHKRYAETLRAALAKAKGEGQMRPFHDGRHSSITNAAAADWGRHPDTVLLEQDRNRPRTKLTGKRHAGLASPPRSAPRSSFSNGSWRPRATRSASSTRPRPSRTTSSKGALTWLAANPGASKSKIERCVSGDNTRLRELLDAGRKVGRYSMEEGPRNAQKWSLGSSGVSESAASSESEVSELEGFTA
jgi:integrase